MPSHGQLNLDLGCPTQPLLPNRSGRPDHLYFALKPPIDMEGEMADLVARIHEETGSHRKPVDLHRMHVSLWCLGQHDGLPPFIERDARRLADAIEAAPCEVSFNRLSKFGGDAIVLHSDTRLHGIHALRWRIANAMAGIPASGLLNSRGFEPHMTMYRTNEPFADREIAPIRWRASEFVLVHSRPRTDFHQVLGAWPLTAAAMAACPAPLRRSRAGILFDAGKP